MRLATYQVETYPHLFNVSAAGWCAVLFSCLTGTLIGYALADPDPALTVSDLATFAFRFAFMLACTQASLSHLSPGIAHGSAGPLFR